MQRKNAFEYEALEGSIIRLFDGQGTGLFAKPRVVNGQNGSSSLVHGGLRLDIEGGQIRLLAGEETLLEEIPYAPDPLRTYIRNPIIDREHGEVKGGVGEGTLLDDGFHYKKIVSFKVDERAEFYGLGDHVGPLSRRGYEFVNYNTDDPSDHTENKKSLYKSFPFVLIRLGKGYLGLYLDNSHRTLFDCQVEPGRFTVAALDGALDFYFAYDEDPKAVLFRFSAFLGRISLPPRWALGLQQTRWGYDGEQEILRVVEGYKRAGIPLSAVDLDIDYMDEYRVFSFDKNRFPDPKGFFEKMEEKKVKVVAIIDPGVKKENGYRVYEKMHGEGLVATLEGKEYINEVWPGEAVYPAFNDEKTAAAWGDYLKEMLDLGVAGFWNDMNEPASFKGELPPEVDFAGVKHREMHNLYGLYMGRATARAMLEQSRRPFVITRATFMGGQKDTVAWTGDNHSTFDSLRLLPSQLANLGVSLYPFVGSDVGGFGGDATPELIRKWAAFAVACPLFRNHSAINTRRQEPFVFDERTVEAYRKAALRRYELVPFIYDWFFASVLTGIPFLRPLFLEFPSDDVTRDLGNELFLGKELLAAPILEPGPDVRVVYFPKGSVYYPFAFGEKIEGGSWEPVEGQDGLMPLFAREGSVVPLYPEGHHDLTRNPEVLRLRVYPGRGKHYHYLDAGDGLAYKKGEYVLYEFLNDNGKITCRLLHKGMESYRKIIVEAVDGSYELPLND